MITVKAWIADELLLRVERAGSGANLFFGINPKCGTEARWIEIQFHVSKMPKNSELEQIKDEAVEMFRIRFFAVEALRAFATEHKTQSLMLINSDLPISLIRNELSYCFKDLEK
jgi:hypothetical protein